MADSEEKGKRTKGNVSAAPSSTDVTDKGNISSEMEVDPQIDCVDTRNDNVTLVDTGVPSSSDKETANKASRDERKEEEEFLVVEEDDGGDEDRVEKEPEPMDATISEEKARPVTTSTSEIKKLDSEEEVLLVNPLFKPENAVPPVIDIESSSSSSDDSDEEDFSEDVNVNNFILNPDDADGIGISTISDDGDAEAKEGAAGDSSQPARTNGGSCGYDCYQEKGILVNEIERLRRAVFELSERHSVLEDFVEVEFSQSFDKFLKNREHLVSMGFGGKDSEGSEDIIDGKRSSKSAELIELLKMIKEQASTKVKEESENTSSSKKPSSNSNQPNKNQQAKQKPKSQAKSIPSIASQRDRGSGRGGALSYNQRPVIVPNVVSAMNFQYPQQLLAHQQGQQGAQGRLYYESIYGHGRDSRDFITAVGRTELYPSSSASYGGYGYGSRSDGGSSKESKKQRKRKRQSEASSEASSATVSGSGASNIPNGGNGKGQGQQQKGFANKSGGGDDDIEIIDYNADLNVNTRRICPLCEKIVSRKALRDHLIIVHQGHKVACPVCQTEFLQRRRIKTHMRDAHDLPVSEYSAYIEKIYNTIDEQCGPWVDKLMKEAETPTKDQLLVHNAELQISLLAKREQRAAAAAASGGVGGASSASNTVMKAPAPPSRPSALSSSSSRAAHSSSSGGGAGRRDRDRDMRRDRDSRGGGSSSSYSSSHSQSVRYFSGANTKVSGSKMYGGSVGSRREPPAADMYGPGGYAQYAQRYLQERAAVTGVSRIYQSF